MSVSRWKIRLLDTRLIHEVMTLIPAKRASSAVTLCHIQLTIDWVQMTEMPASATVTCLRCAIAK